MKKAENSDNVDQSQAHERNRTDDTRKANRYLKRIYYGNRKPYLPELGRRILLGLSHLLSSIMKTATTLRRHPTPMVGCLRGRHFLHQQAQSGCPGWTHSRHTVRASRSVPIDSVSVSSCSIISRRNLGRPIISSGPLISPIRTEIIRKTRVIPSSLFLDSVDQSGYVRQSNGSYLKKSLPPLQFTYTKAEVREDVREVDPRGLENLPAGLDGATTQWVDLDGEGLSGILTDKPGRGGTNVTAVRSTRTGKTARRSRLPTLRF
jgi:hypothetical protein